MYIATCYGGWYGNRWEETAYFQANRRIINYLQKAIKCFDENCACVRYLCESLVWSANKRLITKKV